MKLKPTIILLFLSVSVYSQTIQREFGKYSNEEGEMTSYEKDKDAKAVVLFDIGESKFIDKPEGGYNIEFRRLRRVKVFDPSYTDITEVAIPYYTEGYDRTETITMLKAQTLVKEGSSYVVKKVEKDAIFEEQINNNWKQKKFIFPDVKEGSIIEYEYVLETPFHFNLPDWRFQDRIPTIYSEYKVAMIPFYEYVYLAQGITTFSYKNSLVSNVKRRWGSVSKSYGQNMDGGIEFSDYIHTYVLKDVPAFKDESYITSKEDYIAKIDFQLARFNHPNGSSSAVITTWPELNKDMLKHEKFGRYLKGSAKLAKGILNDEISLKGSTDNEKAKEIINHVKRNFKWSGYYGKYTSRKPKAFVTQREGNVADINLFLIALLNEAGIKSKPVLISTRGNGKINADYPFKHYFNYVIVLVESENPFLADATNLTLPAGRIPARCYNDKGLIVDEDRVNFLDLAIRTKSISSKTLSYTNIDAENGLSDLSVTIQSNEYKAAYLRESFNDNPEKLAKYYSSDDVSFDVNQTINYESPSKPYTVNISGKKDLEIAGSTIIMKPFGDFTMSKNPLTQKKRTYPVDFVYPFSEQYSISIEIPEGYQPSELPEPLKITSDLAEITLNYDSSDEEVTIKGKYEFKKAVYQPSEYARVKYYLNEIVKHFNKEIALTKK